MKGGHANKNLKSARTFWIGILLQVITGSLTQTKQNKTPYIILVKEKLTKTFNDKKKFKDYKSNVFSQQVCGCLDTHFYLVGFILPSFVNQDSPPRTLNTKFLSDWVPEMSLLVVQFI